VFLTTPDAHLVSLDINTGKVNWNVVIADSKKGFWSTMAPLVVRDHVLVGVSGDFDNLPGTLKSFDPDTGDRIQVVQDPPSPFPVGETLVTLSVTEGKEGMGVVVKYNTVFMLIPPSGPPKATCGRTRICSPASTSPLTGIVVN
jgi:outer membrane protein assembly factor BamB